MMRGRGGGRPHESQNLGASETFAPAEQGSALPFTPAPPPVRVFSPSYLAAPC